MSNKMIDSCAKAAYEINGISPLAPLTPFISSEMPGSLAADALEKGGLGELAPILPFIGSDVVEGYIKNKMKK